MAIFSALTRRHRKVIVSALPTRAMSAFRGVKRGEPSGVSRLRFINFLQNHDQIGNRARAGSKPWRKTEAIEARSPAVAGARIPMLFMARNGAPKHPSVLLRLRGRLASGAPRSRRNMTGYAQHGDAVLILANRLFQSLFRLDAVTSESLIG